MVATSSRRGAAPFIILLAGFAVSCATTSTTPRDDRAATVREAERSDAPTYDSADGPRQESAPSTAALEPAVPGAPLRVPVSAGERAPIAFPAGLPTSEANPNTMVAHFIDVGQGDATLLEFSCGAILIDTGGEGTDEVTGRERLKTYLEEFFARRADLAWTLNLVVLSHPHKDHTDGVSVLLQHEPAFTIENILDNGAQDTGSGITGQRALQSHAGASGAGYVGLTETDIATTAGATDSVIDPINCRQGNQGVDPKIAVLWGRTDLDTGWANNANNDSIVLRVAFGKAVFLFTGDLEVEGIEAMLDSYQADQSAFDIDVLKVGHHGSRNATTADFVAALTPKIAVIQSGDSTLSRATFSAYSFAHPNQNAVNLLLDSAHGVSMQREPVRVRVGVKGRNPSTGEGPRFTNKTISRAIYANGWDGNIAVTADANGTLSVETGF